MQKELKIITHLKQYGIEKTVEKFKLEYKDLNHKFILRYKQIGNYLVI